MTGLVATTTRMPAGGGAYHLRDLTVGLFLNNQPTHRLLLGSGRQRHIPLHRNQGWILPPGAEGLCEYDAPLDVTMVSISAELLADITPSWDPKGMAPVVGELDPLLVQMVLRAEDFARQGTLYRQTMGHALAAHMLQVLQPPEPGVPILDDLRLRRAVEYVRAHLADDLSLSAMANVAAMSPSHFARAFRRATGTSPLQFVIAERLDMALVLLRGTRLNIAEIACRVGYQDISRFGQHFKRRFGQSPGVARDG